MHTGRIIFAQLMDWLPRYEFTKCVRRYGGNYRVRTFSCLDQFLCMACAQLTFRESLRDIETCLRALQPKLYHAGLRGPVARSTLADANETRDWRIYADFAQGLIHRARTLYADEPLGVELEETAYAFDATTIALCLALFPWARFRRHKGAIQLHTLLDLRGSIPCFVHITEGKTAEVTVLDALVVEPGAVSVRDRGYIDFARLYALTQRLAFFVVRAKRDLDYRRCASHPVDRTTGLRSDQTIRLRGAKSAHRYPAPLRRITYRDAETDKRFVFLTNHCTLPALTIADLYHRRWRVELFFKWLKQHLRLKGFYGLSENAVKTQVWVALSVYVLVAIVKKELKLDRSLGEILQMLSLTRFEKEELSRVLTASDGQNEPGECGNQLNLFDP